MNRSQVDEFIKSFFISSDKYTEKFAEKFVVSLGSESVSVKANTNESVGSLVEKSLIPSKNTHPLFALEIWRTSPISMLPDLSWAKEYLGSDHSLPFRLTDPFRLAFDKSQGFIFLYDTKNKIGSIWIAPDSQISFNSFITPFRLMFSWMADSIDAEIVHASGISLDGKGAIINGPSGSGKSTLALLSAQNGFGMVADDVVLCAEGEIYAVYNYAKIDPKTSPLDIDGFETFQLTETPEAKRILHLSSFRNNFILRTHAKALIFPIFAHINHFERITPNTAIKLLAPNSLREIMGGTPANFKRLLKLVGALPAFRVAVSANNEKNMQSVREIFGQI